MKARPQFPFSKIAIGVLSVFLLFSGFLNTYLLMKNADNYKVTEVHDGDTFTLGDGQRVRLIGANAPELGNCYAEDAKNKLSSLVLGKTVRITDEKRDTYGRRMGLVYVGNILVNDVLIREGFARPDYTPNSQSEKLKNAYVEAKDNNRGIHSPVCKKVNPTPSSQTCVIKGNIDKATGDHFYHLPSCRHYNQIVLDEDTGEGFFCTEKEAALSGFKLAPDCLR
jgi:endonuclease YncB( thermonuclease family)